MCYLSKDLLIHREHEVKAHVCDVIILDPLQALVELRIQRFQVAQGWLAASIEMFILNHCFVFIILMLLFGRGL